MKFILIGLTLIVAVTAQFDSATQGPNPQDIATPEPEYIDIDLPPPPGAAAAPPPPAPLLARAAPIHVPAPIAFNAPRPQQQQQQQYLPPVHHHHVPGPGQIHRPSVNYIAPVVRPQHGIQPAHSYSPNDGYRYKTVRRLRYRFRY